MGSRWWSPPTARWLGRLRAAALAADPDRRAEQVMEAGPSTVRPDRRLEELVELMREHDLTVMLVTTPGGPAAGCAARSLAEQTLGA